MPSHLIKSTTATVLVLLLITFYYVEPSNAAINSLALTEDKPQLELSQYLTLEIVHSPANRDSIYVEFLALDDDSFSLQLLPRSSDVVFRLIDFTPLKSREAIIFENEKSDVKPWLEDYSVTRSVYRLSQPFVVFRYSSRTIDHKIIDKSTPKATSDTGGISLAVKKGYSGKPLGVVFEPLSRSIDNGDYRRISPIYRYDLDDDAAYDRTKPLTVQMPYSDDSAKSKIMMYYDTKKLRWFELPSYNNPELRYVQAEISLPFAWVAVFENPQSEDGIASWYRYKGCLCAASRDYPKGSRVKVTRLKSGASVIVTINDFGPELWTGRLIDLDITAFRKLGTVTAGLIYVKIEPAHD